MAAVLLDIFSWQNLLKFLVTFVFAFLYGLQRQRSHKAVGFGAFTLVAIGSCGLAIVASELTLTVSIGLISAIVTGIGFLGAGALIRTSDKIFGFTTAASIWLFAIFGMVIGLGMYTEGAIMYALVWIVVLVDIHLERRGIGSYRREIAITTHNFVDKKYITEILAKFCSKFTLIKIEVNKKNKDVSLSYLIEGKKNEIESLLRELYGKHWCASVELE